MKQEEAQMGEKREERAAMLQGLWQQPPHGRPGAMAGKSHNEPVTKHHPGSVVAHYLQSKATGSFYSIDFLIRADDDVI